MLALLLAATGIYGSLAYHVASRTGEIGIRVALGATRANVRWLVVAEALRLVFAGIAFGLLLAFVAGRFVQGLLYGVRFGRDRRHRRPGTRPTRLRRRAARGPEQRMILALSRNFLPRRRESH